MESLDTPLNLDFHLMTKEPALWVERALRGGADRVIGQIEGMSDQVAFIGKVAEVGLSVGLALDLDTGIDKIDPTILSNLDVVLVMSVKAGFSGQEFDKRALAKVKELGELRAKDDTPFKICVDGGITEENIREVVKAGADEVAIGKRIFDGDLAQNLERFRKQIHG
jgi:ribulose-phosphate 3-epimerase